MNSVTSKSVCFALVTRAEVAQTQATRLAATHSFAFMLLCALIAPTAYANTGANSVYQQGAAAYDMATKAAQPVTSTPNQDTLKANTPNQSVAMLDGGTAQTAQASVHQPQGESVFTAQAAFAINTQVFEITINQDGSENIIPITAETITTLPGGSLLKYDVTYANQLSNRIDSAKARIDIPKGLILENEGLEPAQVYASLDGEKFYPYPIKLQSADGQAVSAAMRKYRALEWSLRDVKPNEHKTVSFRATKK